jgi:hypothetical protein
MAAASVFQSRFAAFRDVRTAVYVRGIEVETGGIATGDEAALNRSGQLDTYRRRTLVVSHPPASRALHPCRLPCVSALPVSAPLEPRL